MTEPEYRFVKGQGWVPSYGPVELVIPDTLLKVGDVLLEWGFENKNINTGHDSYIITGISDSYVAINANPYFHRLGSEGYASKITWFRVRRS